MVQTWGVQTREFGDALGGHDCSKLEPMIKPGLKRN